MIYGRNRKALHNYDIEERFEAGIVLFGSEVKSIRAGQVSLNEAYATIIKEEVFIIDMYIAPYVKSSIFKPDPRRKRKLLLKKFEIKRLIGKIQRRGYTIVPLKIYTNERGFIKLELGLGKGKKTIDKREEIKKRDLKREERRRWL